MPSRVPAERLALGKCAEQLAAEHFERLGYRIVSRNWHKPEGELDLVVEHDGQVVFVEVRSRTGTETGHPLETVNAQKRARVIKAARMYIDEVQPEATSFRFDVVGVVFPSTEGHPELIHIEDAFQTGQRSH
jgi:putative endonuclease